LAVHAIDRGLGLRITAHFDKSKAFGSAGITLHHDFGAGDGPELAERLFEIVVTHRIWQVANVEFVAHERDS
jgi:hypothetical protein